MRCPPEKGFLKPALIVGNISVRVIELICVRFVWRILVEQKSISKLLGNKEAKHEQPNGEKAV